MMNKFKTLVAALCLAGTALSSAAQDRVTGETPADYAERMAWFGDAKLGIFIGCPVRCTNFSSLS